LGRPRRPRRLGRPQRLGRPRWLGRPRRRLGRPSWLGQRRLGPPWFGLSALVELVVVSPIPGGQAGPALGQTGPAARGPAGLALGQDGASRPGARLASPLDKTGPAGFRHKSSRRSELRQIGVDLLVCGPTDRGAAPVAVRR
jgi:hypothetical protein